MVFLFGALCYTVCTMKAPTQGLGRSLHGIYGSLFSMPWKGLERRGHGVPVQCSVLYSMHHEGSSPGPGRAWGGAFMTFIFIERYV